MSKLVYIETAGLANTVSRYHLNAQQVDQLRQIATAMQHRRTQRIEQRAAELYAVGCTLPEQLDDITPAMWAVFAAVVRNALADREEELEALELYGTMQEGLARL